MTRKVVPARKDIPDSDKWNLTLMFDSNETWEKGYRKAEKDIGTYEQFRGRVGESAEMLQKVIELDLDISREIEMLYVYSHLKSDEDKSNQHYLGMHQRAVTLHSRAAELSSFITPEIQNIADEKIGLWLSETGLSEYSFYLKKILRYKPHTLDEKTERIIAMSHESTDAASQIFSQLDNVDLRFGTVTDDTGEEVEISHGNFSTFMIHSNRDLRKRVFEQYYRVYREHENTIASALSCSNKKDLFYSRVRNFNSCRSAALFADNVPENVYDNLIDTVRENSNPVFEYLELRKKILKVDELHFYDTYVPIIPDISFSMTYEDAVDTCIKALSPLGGEYVAVLEEGLRKGWVDRYENRGKRSGAYSSGCYDSPPYILMNYEEKNINSLYTLIHEAGHSMHSFLSTKNQPYVYHDYTIFVAEVASTFNETLLSSYLLDLYRDNPVMRSFILNREIDNLRGTLFRQTMFAEFEKITHKIVEANEPLTLEVMTEAYRNLLRDYFGDVLCIDSELELEYLRIPHFYRAFYVYKYATGISAAIALADMVMKGGEKERNAYLNFLKLGGSKFPLDELLEAGVDMRVPDPVKKAIDHFQKRVFELKKEMEFMG